jgi:AsmA family/AsmA-like C-terminal region
MRRFFRFILAASGIFAGLLALLFAAAAIIIPIRYPPKKLKAMGESKLSSALHRKVEVGDVHFNILSGFEVQGLKIANRPGWSPQPFVSAKEISISYHLWPLLWGKVSLGQVRLNQPEILVERRSLGEFNFTDMIESTKNAENTAAARPPEPSFSLVARAWADDAPKTSAGGSPSKTALGFSVDGVNIIHGKLVYLDETGSPARRYDCDDLNFDVRHISMAGGLSDFSLSTPFTADKTPYQLSLKGSYRYFLAGQSLKGLRLAGTVNDLGFRLSGSAHNLTDDFAPDMEGEASLDMLKFSGLVPASLSAMPAGLSLTGPASVDFHLGGSVKAGLQLSGTADGSALVIRYKDLFVKTDKTPCKVEFKSVIGQSSYDLPSFKAVYADWTVTGDFHYPRNGAWSCGIHSGSLPFRGLPGMLPKLNKTSIDGSGSVDLSIRQAPGRSLPFTVNGRVTLKGVGITLPNEPYLQSMDGVIDCADNVVRVPSLTFQSFGGRGVAGVTLNGNTEAYVYGFRLAGVDLQKTVDASVDAYVASKDAAGYKDKLYGTLNLAYAGAGRGFSGNAMLAGQAGRGDYSITGSKIKGLAAVTAINKYFKDSSDEIKFDQMTGLLGLKDGVFTFTADTAGKVGAVRERGAINLEKMAYFPDMTIQCDLKKEFLNSDAVLSGLPGAVRGLVKDVSWLSDDRGNIPVDVKFTGPVKENRYSYDWSRLTQNVKNRLGAEVKRAAGEKIRQGAKDLGQKLKGLFGH